VTLRLILPRITGPINPKVDIVTYYNEDGMKTNTKRINYKFNIELSTTINLPLVSA